MAEREKSIPFLITLSFLAAFLAIRLIVFAVGAAETEFARAAEMGGLPETRFHIGRNVILFGYHIHHFYFGILLVCVAGWLAIVDSTILTRRALAVVYGAGLGLFMDEIGLLLTWGDYYSSLSYLLTLLLAAVFLNVIFFPRFWEEMRKKLLQQGSRSILLGGISRNLVLVRAADAVSGWIGRGERAELVFSGVLSVAVGALVLAWPGFVQYWVSGLFLLQGLTHLVEAFSGGVPMKRYERVGLLVSGVVYIGAGVLMLFYHRLLVYWIAAVFLVHGVSSLVRSWRKPEP